LLDFAERSVFSIAQGKLDRSFSPINAIIKESLDLVDKLSKRKEHVTGVPTGFYDLDDITAGLQASDLVRDRRTAQHGQDKPRARHGCSCGAACGNLGRHL
jgi:replicative DNA helicase